MGLQRQNSGGSSASGFSAGSGATSASRVFKQAGGDDANGHDQQPKGLTTALFGVLFTLSKEKNDSKKMAIAAIFVDFFLLFVLMVTPDYPWAINREGWIWKMFWYAEFHQPFAWQGSKFYLVVFYLLSSFLVISVAMCVWVAWCFKNDHFPFLWPIQVLRVVVSLFFGMTYIVSLNIFIMMLVCVKKDNTWIHAIYLDECFAPPHLIHLIASFCSSLLFTGVAFLMTIAEHDLEPATQSLSAMPHSMCELRLLALKTIIAVVRIILRPQAKNQGIIFLICFALMFYYSIKMLPNYVAWVNCLRCGLWLVCTYIAAILCAILYIVDGVVEEHPMAVHSKLFKKLHLAHASHDSASSNSSNSTQPSESVATAAVVHRRHIMSTSSEITVEHGSTWKKQVALTQLMWYGLLPVFLLGAFAAYIRLYCMWKAAMKLKYHWQEGMRYKDVYRFSDDYEVEIVSRVMRVWDEDENMDQDAVELAETVFKAGLSMFPKSAFLHIMYSNFLVEIQGNTANAWGHLEQARKMNPNLSFRFSIFTREQEHKQQAAGSSTGEATVDLVSYVQFQRSHKMLMSYHRAALLASREFWQQLLKQNISITKLVKSCRNIEVMEDKATKTFQSVLERYPRSAKLLRSYAAFLEQVKNDPWTAAKYISEAEKAEEAQDDAGDGAGGEETGGMGKIDEKVDAVVTINGAGIIQTANKNVCKLFGYKEGDLDHKNISALMPPPFSQRHNGYLKNYATTGKAKILDTRREVVALHKERFVFPVAITVTKVSGAGAEAIFMGVLRPIEMDASQLKVYVLTNGLVLCCDQSFTDCLGWAPGDVTGKNFASISEEQAKLQKLFDDAAGMSEEDVEKGGCHSEIKMKHKYGDPITLNIKVMFGGTESQRLYVLVLTRIGPPPLAFTINPKGQIMYVTTSLCTLLGYTSKQLLGKSMSMLLPAPWGQLHMRWLKETEQPEGVKRFAFAPCKQGQTMLLAAKNSSLVPVKMSMKQLDNDSESDLTSWFIQMEKSAKDNQNDERRLTMTMNSLGIITDAVPASTSLFNFDPRVVVGSSIASVVDIFNMWTDGGNDIGTAVSALMLLANGQSSISWRVGVLSQAGDLIAADSNDQRRMKKSSSFALKPKAAVMQIIPDLDDTDEDGHVMMTVHLWKAEALTSVIEVSNDGDIVRVDAKATLVFGCSSSALNKQNLSSFMKLPGGSNVNALMSGHLNHKRGGMSKAHLNTTGPRKLVDAKHQDGRPIQFSIQTSLKDGNGKARAQVMVKVVNTARGALDAIKSALQMEEEEGERARTPVSRNMSPSPVPRLMSSNSRLPLAAGQTSSFSTARPVFKLSLDKVQEQQQTAVTRAATPPAGATTNRTHDPLATARDIELDIALTARGTAQGQEDQLATARLVEIDLDKTPRAPTPSHNPGSGDPSKPVYWPSFHSQPGAPEAGSQRAATPSNEIIADARLEGNGQGQRVGRIQSLTPSRQGTPRPVVNDQTNGQQIASLLVPSLPVTLPGEVTTSIQEGNNVRMSPKLHLARGLTDLTGAETPAGSQNGSQVFMRAETCGTMISNAHDASEESEEEEEEDENNGKDEDPEAAATRKSVKKVQHWIDTDFQTVIHGKGEGPTQAVIHALTTSTAHNHLQEEDEGPPHIPRIPSIRNHTAAADNEADFPKLRDEKHTADNASVGGESMGDAASVTSNGTVFKRGKRLKRLMKIICGKKAQAPLEHLRLHTWGVMAALCLLHLAAFILVLNLLSKQHTYLDNVVAAGEANAVMHRIMLQNRNIEAALRGYYFNASDIPQFTAKMTSLLDRMEYLHNGLYLGFKGLHKPSNPGFWTLWQTKMVPITQFKDADPPQMYNSNLSLWEAGNQFIAAGREVAFAAATKQAGYNITTSRFWQYIYLNGFDSLAEYYDSSMDTLVHAAIEHVRKFELALIFILILEGCVLSLSAMLYMLFMLRHVIMQRVATFSAFLYLPTGFIKNMASKKMKLADGSDSDSESGHDDAPKPLGNAPSEAGDTDNGYPDHANNAANKEPSNSRRISTNSARRRASVEAPDLRKDAGPSRSGMRKVSISALASLPAGNNQETAKDTLKGAIEQGGLRSKSKLSIMGSFVSRKGSLARLLRIGSTHLVMNGKQFINIWGDLFKVTWPFTAWSIAVISLYLSCLLSAAGMEHFMVDMVLSYGVSASVPRVQLFMTEAALVPSPTYQAAIKEALDSEAAELDEVFQHSLYGGSWILHVMRPDQSIAHVAMNTQGTVFTSKKFADFLFRTKACLAESASTCVNETSVYYPVTHSAVNPMVIRLMEEAKLMARDRIEDLYPGNSSRFSYALDVAGHDLRESIASSALMTYARGVSMLDYLKTLNVILFLICMLLWVTYTFVTFKPFLQNSVKVGCRVAELLSQLPGDMDVEGMVQHSWKQVMSSALQDEDDHDSTQIRAQSMAPNRLRPKPIPNELAAGGDAQPSFMISAGRGGEDELGDTYASRQRSKQQPGAVAEGVVEKGLWVGSLRRRHHGESNGEDAV